MRPGEAIGGRFAVESLAGSGGMGDVYRARDLLSGDYAAVKVLREAAGEGAARLEREAQVLIGLSHPRVVRYVAHGTVDAGHPYLATEWLDGENLASRIDREPLTIEETIAIGIGVAQGLGAAHRHGVIHRDIKPSNIFLVGRRIEGIKVLDFGIARFNAESPTPEQLTKSGMLIGTVGYLSPEQARGERDIDPRADVFSLACVLFRCLTQELPFAADDMLSVLARLLLDEAPRVGELCPDVPAALEDLITRMLSKDPKGRPADGVEVAAALAAIDARGGERSAPKSHAPRLTDAERRVMCAVLARLTARFPSAPSGNTQLPTRVLDRCAQAGASRGALEEKLWLHGGELSVLADGSLLVTAPGSSAFTDQVGRAARCALALREVLPDAAIALVAGRGEVRSRLPMGDVVDAGLALLTRAARNAREADEAGAPPAPSHVRIDEGIAGLLASSFEVLGDRDDLFLVREHDAETTPVLPGRATPFIGRERELAMLMSIYDTVASEPSAHVVRVTGPEGIGKSRLLQEFVVKLRAEHLPFALWTGRGDPGLDGAPFGVLAPLVRRLAGILDGEPPAVRQRKLRARVGRHVPEADRARIVEFLGELIGTPFSEHKKSEEYEEEESALLRHARQDAVLLSDQVRRAFEDFVEAECAAQPVVIVIEDLAWGDFPSLQLIDGALGNLADHRLLVLGVGRPDLHRRFPELWAGRPSTDLRLNGLSRRASEVLVRQTLGASADAATVERLIAQSGGNALYLEELLRAVAQPGGEAVPATVLAMVQARLARLDPDLRRVLRAASVFGQAFWHGGVLALLGSDPPTGDLRLELAELAQQEVIQPRSEARFAGENEFVFQQALVREAAYAMLTDADRALGHHLAGSWLEDAGESEAAVLAEHFERGGHPSRAVAAYRRATEQALGSDDFAAAVTWAERGIACCRSTRAGAGAAIERSEAAELGALLLLQAEAYAGRGELARAQASALDALEVLAQLDPAAMDPAARARCLELAQALAR